MADSSNSCAYRVLARTYRSISFTDLIGQEGLVKVLSNAIMHNRLPHAIILTGVRGTGKTTTARILARCLNCIGPDGKGHTTITPCGECEPCRAILKENHVDVLEMDAASHTGVEDIREIIEAVRYKPISARYKIYIIDEVHMLSRNAFNALLKTLEEPPAHVKFIFATTDIHKVPDTILSRCMRFDLKRIEESVLIKHFQHILEKENRQVEEEGLALIARAADGSARDGLSLLDKALNLNPNTVTTADVRHMLHLSDRIQMLTLLENLMTGQMKQALMLFQEIYHQGGDPITLIEELLDMTHWVSLTQQMGELAHATGATPQEKEQTLKLAHQFSTPVLARFWQVLLKGHTETKNAPNAFQAAQMLLIRLTYLANLPTPDQIIQQLQTNATDDSSISSFAKSSPISTNSESAAQGQNTTTEVKKKVVDSGAPEKATPFVAEKNPLEDKPCLPKTFEDMILMVSEKGEPLMAAHLKGDVIPVTYQPGALEIHLTNTAPKDLAKKLRPLLEEWTGIAWSVTTADHNGAKTLDEQTQDRQEEKIHSLKSDPLIKTALETFPEAEIVSLDGQDVKKRKRA